MEPHAHCTRSATGRHNDGEGDKVSTREPPEGTSFRAVAKRLGSTSDGLWHGRWRPFVGAQKQARRWAALADTVEVWIEEGHYDGVGHIEIAQRLDVGSDDIGQRARGRA